MGHLVRVDPGGGVKERVSAENGIIPLIRIKQSIYTLCNSHSVHPYRVGHFERCANSRAAMFWRQSAVECFDYR